MPWIAGASVYSGRPDPEWQPEPRTVEQLLAIWDRLDAAAERPDVAPPLGYRGCYLLAPAGAIWRAYGRGVAMTEGGVTVARQDPARDFERTLLRSAPPRLLPPEVAP